MGQLFGKKKDKKCCCDVACNVCDCENPSLACRVGSLVSSTIPDDPCAGARVNGGDHTIPSDKYAWVDTEDTPTIVIWDGFHITIPCELSPLSLVGVLVRRSNFPSGPSPYIDNDIVQPCEYYFVLYSEDLSSYTIHYEYEICCGRAEAVPTCQTRPSWINVTNVSAGRGVYNFLFWNKSGSAESGGNGVLVGECPFSDGPSPCES